MGVANIWGVGKEVSPVSLSRITGVPRIDTRKQDCGCGHCFSVWDMKKRCHQSVYLHLITGGSSQEVDRMTSPVSVSPLSLELVVRRLTD